MSVLKIAWKPLLITLIRSYGILVAGAVISPSPVQIGSEVVPVEISAWRRTNPVGRDINSQIERRDGELPTALINTFQSSSWIWTVETDPPKAPASDRAFRSTFVSPTGKVATSAIILLSVDDRFSFYVNGNLVGTSPTTPDSWKNAQVYTVTLAPTRNVFAIRGTNLPDVNIGGPSPAGVLVAIQVKFSDGLTSLLSSSGGWRATKVVPDGFESPSFDDSQWDPASLLFKYGDGPWLNGVVLPTGGVPTITSSVSASSTSMTQSMAIPTVTNNTTSGAHEPVGAIAGGVLGGVVILLLVVLVYLWRKRRPRHIRASLFSQSTGLELSNRSSSTNPSFHADIAQPQITGVSQHILPPSASSVYHSTLTPSMSMSHVNQGSDTAEFRDRIERLEGLVMELDREIASGGSGSRVEELRTRLAEESAHQNRDPFAEGGSYNATVYNIPPPAYETEGLGLRHAP